MALNDDPCFEIVSLDWERALVSFCLPDPSPVEAECFSPQPRTLCAHKEENLIGRMALEGLAPGADHEILFRWTGGEETLLFRTLPAPQGELICAFAAVADPHVSVKPEPRKGRLFVESAALFAETVEEANALRLDAFLVAGDLTNTHQEAEYAAARDVLSRLKCPLFAVPGNHDIVGGDERLWREYFGETSCAGEVRGVRVVGLDTAACALGESGRRLLAASLDGGPAPLVAVAHHQLVPDDYIFQNKKCVEDQEENAGLVARLAEHGGLWYAGHLNVPSRIQQGRFVQLNLPQTCQYPCGYVLVRRYANGFFHTFRPIRSEVLNAWSRAECVRAAERYGEPQWTPEYRRGRSYAEMNFLYETANGNDE